jgi:hypothetical protein
MLEVTAPLALSANTSGRPAKLMIKLATQPNPGAVEVLLTGKELKARWKCHSATLQRWTRDGILNPIMIGGKFRRYRLTEIERIEREGTK